MSQPTTTEHELARKKLLEELVADGLAIQDRFRPEPLLKLTGKGYYRSDQVADIAAAKKSKK